MSALNTMSVFYYGTVITKDNKNLNFDEGSGELTAPIQVNDYSLEEFGEAIATAMTLAGTQTYTVTIDRDTRQLTISATNPFDLLSITGSQVGSSPWSLMGFTSLSDYTGMNSYEGEAGAGFEYRPQMLLDNYLKPEDYVVKESAVVNQSANGVVQTLIFGDGQRMRCNVRGATNLTGIYRHYNQPFYENATGIQDLRDFLNYLITKAKLEFMPDIDNRDEFYTLLLESTDADRSGTKYIINNMQGANNFFETGQMLFRKVIE